MCSDTYKDTIEDITKGALEFGENKIKQLVQQFKNGKLAFIQDQETIDLVKKQLESGEWDLCKGYIKDDFLKLLVKMGLTLRELDRLKETKKIQNLKQKINIKFGPRGIHISEIVQNKLLTSFIGSLAKTINTVPEMIEYIEKLLNNLDNYVIFIKNTDNVKNIHKIIETKIMANTPDFLIIFSCGSAIQVAMTLKSELFKMQIITENYTVEIQEEGTEGINKYLIFLFKQESNLFEDK